MGVPLVLSPEQIGPAIPAILQLGQAHFAGQCLHAIVKLGVPDIIGNGKLAVEDIARELPGVNGEALGRTLRILTCSGVFEESASPDGECVYNLTPAGALLQTKAPQPSVACGILTMMDPALWGSWNLLPDYVAGSMVKPPFEELNGMRRFPDYFDKHPESAHHFNEFMSFFSKPELSAVLGAGCWEGLADKTVVDVGGNLGTVMGAVAERFPDVKCVSFDLPRVIDSAGEPPKGVTFAKGDMYQVSTIPKGDAIFMKHILHDWRDSDAERILKNCHQVLPEDGGRVIIAEAVLPEAGALAAASRPGIFLDILMMVIGGKERTRRQWEALADAAGFRVEKVVTGLPTCHIVILEKV